MLQFETAQCEASNGKENGLVNDRSSFRLASALVFAGELLYIAAGVFHPGRVPANQHPEVFAEYANDAYWGAVHMGQFLGMAVLLSGLVLLAVALGTRSGVLDWLGRLAAASAVVTIALTGVLQAVDGVALKTAADAWLAAAPADQMARLAATETVRWLEWAVRSYQRTMLGITLILVSAQILATVRMPRPIAFVMALSGFAYIAQGVVVGAEGFSSNGTIPELAAFVFDLAWMIWLVVVAWQKPKRVRPLATAPVSP
jgi:hypothetical protein